MSGPVRGAQDRIRVSGRCDGRTPLVLGYQNYSKKGPIVCQSRASIGRAGASLCAAYMQHAREQRILSANGWNAKISPKYANLSPFNDVTMMPTTGGCDGGNDDDGDPLAHAS